MVLLSLIALNSPTGTLEPPFSHSCIRKQALQREDGLAQHHRRSLQAEARRWFPDRPRGYLETARTLKHYAANKATAMGLRLAGKVANAMNYEGICERL
jgi:hypothetical protein